MANYFLPGGENSGASQQHKHVQFIPVDEDYDVPPIEELAKDAQLESQGETNVSKCFSM